MSQKPETRTAHSSLVPSPYLLSPITLLTHFDAAARTPADVARLKQLILQLAVRGRLVPQDPNDESVDVSMAQIGKERSERASEFGLSAPPRLIQDIEYVNGPNEIPPNWRWVSLSSLLLHDHGGKTPSKNNPRFWGGEVPWASVKDLNDEGALSKTQDTITKQALDESGVPLVPAGNIIVCVRMAIGRIAINQMDVAINQDLRAFYLPKAINKAYFILAYRTLQIEGSGMTVKGVRKKDLHDVPFPLPPTAEQHRIVAQVDHLLAQADELAARLAAAETQRRRGHAAALARLTAPAPAEAPAAWPLLAAHFDPLHATPDALAPLRAAILQLAVMGRLVPQDAKDEPAGGLLERIRNRAQELAGERGIRLPKPLPPVDAGEEPFTVPNGWKWVHLDHLCYQITDGTHYTPKYTDTGVPFLSVKDISAGVINFSNTRHISSEEHALLSARCRPEYGDLLLTKVGTTGIAKVVDTNREFSIFVSIALLKFPQELVEPYFLELLINSPLVKEQSERFTMGVGNQNLVLKYIRSFVIPLPPLAEQHRIVAQVNDLLSQIDQLAAHLAAAETTRQRWLAAVVAGAGG